MEEINPKEVQQEVQDFLKRKYGNRIEIYNDPPCPDPDESNEVEKSGNSTDTIDFDISPADLYTYLDTYVVKQHEAKQILATKICTHFNRLSFYLGVDGLEGSNHTGRVKNNVVLLGPTGVGKTYLIKLIAKRIGVPFVKGDATKFSETGYMGGNVEDLIKALVREADNDLNVAQFGIVYIDEIDKIAGSPNSFGLDISRTGVQRNLLKLFEDTDVDLTSMMDPMSHQLALAHYMATGEYPEKTISTKNILFIVSGAFNGMEKIINNRVSTSGLGFGSTIKNRKTSGLLRRVEPEDFMEFGFESEFIGRIPVIGVLDPLSEEDLFQILKNKHSSTVLAKKQDFKAYGIDVCFDDGALREVAKRAAAKKTGARALTGILEKALTPFEHHLPKSGVTKFCITEEAIKDPQQVLDEIIKDPEHETRTSIFGQLWTKEKKELENELNSKQGEFPECSTKEIPLVVNQAMSLGLPLETSYEYFVMLKDQITTLENGLRQKYTFQVKFKDEAISKLLNLGLLERENKIDMCRTTINKYHHGINLVMTRTKSRTLFITAKAIEDPKDYVENYLKRRYKNK